MPEITFRTSTKGSGGDFESRVLTLPCGQCGKEFEKSIGWLEVHDEIICDCGGVLKINREQLIQVVRTRQKIIDRMRRSFRK